MSQNTPEQSDNQPTAQGSERPVKKPRGLALLTPERRREIAALGGLAAQESGRAHRFASREEAQAAGRKGGRAVSGDRGHMAAIGRLGGLAGGAGRVVRSTGNPFSDTGL